MTEELTLSEVHAIMEELLFRKPNSSGDEVLICMYLTDRLIRGQIISTFSIVEALMNDLITRIIPDQTTKYANMDAKRNAFKIAIEKYEVTYQKDLSVLKQKMDNIVEKRHNVAHWFLDTSEEGKLLYINKQRLKYRNYVVGKEAQHIFFDKESFKDYETDILCMQKTLASMQNTILS